MVTVRRVATAATTTCTKPTVMVGIRQKTSAFQQRFFYAMTVYERDPCSDRAKHRETNIQRLPLPPLIGNARVRVTAFALAQRLGRSFASIRHSSKHSWRTQIRGSG
jgi:hypothetical protein